MRSSAGFRTQRFPDPVWITVAGGAVYLLARRGLDQPAAALLGVAAATIAVCVALASGITAEQLGMGVDRFGSGFRWGAACGLLAAGVLGITSLAPVGGEFFADDRYADLANSDLAFEVLVRVPFATALVEEVLFRGVLLALFLRRYQRPVAVVASSALFGLWHVLPAFTFADANEGFGSTGALLAVPVTVVVTTLAGCVLAWLRLRSGSLAAPFIVHVAVNATGVLIAAGA